MGGGFTRLAPVNSSAKVSWWCPPSVLSSCNYYGPWFAYRRHIHYWEALKRMTFRSKGVIGYCSAVIWSFGASRAKMEKSQTGLSWWGCVWYLFSCVYTSISRACIWHDGQDWSKKDTKAGFLLWACSPTGSRGRRNSGRLSSTGVCYQQWVQTVEWAPRAGTSPVWLGNVMHQPEEFSWYQVTGTLRDCVDRK